MISQKTTLTIKRRMKIYDDMKRLGGEPALAESIICLQPVSGPKLEKIMQLASALGAKSVTVPTEGQAKKTPKRR